MLSYRYGADVYNTYDIPRKAETTILASEEAIEAVCGGKNATIDKQRCSPVSIDPIE